MLIESLNQSPKNCQNLKNLSLTLKMNSKSLRLYMNQFLVYKTLALEQSDETY